MLQTNVFLPRCYVGLLKTVALTICNFKSLLGIFFEMCAAIQRMVIYIIECDSLGIFNHWLQLVIILMSGVVCLVYSDLHMYHHWQLKCVCLWLCTGNCSAIDYT